MSPAFREHLERMPRSYSEKILFPTVRGEYMRQPNWTHYWNAVRVAAGMPGQEFYELKHRAIQWMVDPVDDGGLGLDRDRRGDGRPRRRRLADLHGLHGARPAPRACPRPTAIDIYLERLTATPQGHPLQ